MVEATRLQKREIIHGYYVQNQPCFKHLLAEQACSSSESLGCSTHNHTGTLADMGASTSDPREPALCRDPDTWAHRLYLVCDFTPAICEVQLDGEVINVGRRGTQVLVSSPTSAGTPHSSLWGLRLLQSQGTTCHLDTSVLSSILECIAGN